MPYHRRMKIPDRVWMWTSILLFVWLFYLGVKASLYYTG
jgi:hypothetical protein